MIGSLAVGDFRGNLVYQNEKNGIYASGNVHAAGNTVAQNGRIGIELDDGADAT